MTALRGDEAALFSEHHDRLVQAVRRSVGAPTALIEDACGFAWEQLVRTQPDRGPRLFAWLRTVAVHEAYRLSKVQRREGELEQLVQRRDDDSTADGWEQFIPARTDLDAHLRAKEALATLASLPERQRRYLTLLVGGHRYNEIVRDDWCDVHERQQAPREGSSVGPGDAAGGVMPASSTRGGGRAKPAGGRLDLQAPRFAPAAPVPDGTGLLRPSLRSGSGPTEPPLTAARPQHAIRRRTPWTPAPQPTRTYSGPTPSKAANARCSRS